MRIIARFHGILFSCFGPNHGMCGIKCLKYVTPQWFKTAFLWPWSSPSLHSSLLYPLLPYILPVFNPCEVGNRECSANEFCLLSTVHPGGFSCVQTTISITNTALGKPCEYTDLTYIMERLLPTLHCISTGSCRAAGHASCCSGGDCQGQPANCYCDANCVLFKDCCSDTPTDCPQPGETAGIAL